MASHPAGVPPRMDSGFPAYFNLGGLEAAEGNLEVVAFDCTGYELT